MRWINTIGNALGALAMLSLAVRIITGDQPERADDHLVIAVAAVIAAGWFRNAAWRAWRKS